MLDADILAFSHIACLFEWEQGDMFVIPSWAVHEHCNSSPGERAILFSLHDTPVMVALNKYREVAYAEHNGHQVLTGVFTPQTISTSTSP